MNYSRALRDSRPGLIPRTRYGPVLVLTLCIVLSRSHERDKTWSHRPWTTGTGMINQENKQVQKFKSCKKFQSKLIWNNQPEKESSHIVLAHVHNNTWIFTLTYPTSLTVKNTLNNKFFLSADIIWPCTLPWVWIISG